MLLRRKKKEKREEKKKKTNVFVAATVVRVAHIDGTKIYSSILEMSLMMMIIQSGGWWGVDVLYWFKTHGFCGLTYIITTIKKISCGHFWLFTKLYVFQTGGGRGGSGGRVRFDAGLKIHFHITSLSIHFSSPFFF